MIAQAINCMAVPDENKSKIIEAFDAGALKYYVRVLNEERSEAELIQAAHGLWILAFKCQDSIVKQPGCLEG